MNVNPPVTAGNYRAMWWTVDCRSVIIYVILIVVSTERYTNRDLQDFSSQNIDYKFKLHTFKVLNLGIVSHKTF